MGKIDQNIKTDVMTECAPEQGEFKIVEWNIRPSDTAMDAAAGLDNSCGCDCGCAELA